MNVWIRPDGRRDNEIRPVGLQIGYVEYPEGSVLITMGKTKVLCNVSIEPGVPRWMQAKNIPGGWITAEYAMLPRSTQQRTSREAGSLGGRSQEIRRLIGRSLRAAVDLKALGARTCTIDCDVLQADGGTRSACISGGYVALELALRQLILEGEIPPGVLISPVAAISAGLVAGNYLLDLCYAEDSIAQFDINVVMDAEGRLIEIQGTAEGEAVSRQDLEALVNLCESGIADMFKIQQKALENR